MTYLSSTMKIKSLTSLVAIGCGLSVQSSFAAITLTMEQVGNDVVVTSVGGIFNPVGAGSTDFSVTNGDFSGATIPGVAVLFIGTNTDDADPAMAEWDGAIVSGPGDFGPGLSTVNATISTGQGFGFNAGGTNTLFVDPDQLFAPGFSFGVGSGATWENTTLEALGVTQGTYVWTLDSARFNNDTITLNVIPEPSSALLLSIAGLGLFRRRR